MRRTAGLRRARPLAPHAESGDERQAEREREPHAASIRERRGGPCVAREAGW